MKIPLFASTLFLTVLLVVSPTAEAQEAATEAAAQPDGRQPTQLVRCLVQEVLWKDAWTPMEPPEYREGFLVSQARWMQAAHLLTVRLPSMEKKQTLLQRMIQTKDQKMALVKEDLLLCQKSRCKKEEKKQSPWLWVAATSASLAAGILIGVAVSTPFGN